MAFNASWEQRQLADRLVELRKAKGLTAEAAAKAAGFGRVKLQRIERAEVKVEPRDVRKLCAIYEVPESEVQQLCDMAIASRNDIWWERFDGLIGARHAEYIAYENEARCAHTIQPVLIPGPLQTMGYARGLYAGSAMVTDPDRVQALVTVRMLRQRRLTEPEPLELRAVIGEAALRKPYGGQAVFHAQLKYLREIVELPNVSIRVVELSRPVVFWPVELLEFHSGGPAVAFTESTFGYVKHDGELEVSQARRVIDRVTQDALPEARSLAFIERLIRETAE